MRSSVLPALVGVFLAVATSAAAAPPALDRAFHPSAWAPLSMDAAAIPGPQGRLVRYGVGEDPAQTLDDLLNGSGRAALEAILKQGGAVFVGRQATPSAFAPDPLLALQLSCPATSSCPGAVAYAARGADLVVAGREVAGGYLLTGLAAPLPPGAAPRPVDRATEVPHFAIRLPESVPEPRSWALLILGFGLVGAAARRAPVLSARPLAR
jgi:hypothetical protein